MSADPEKSLPTATDDATVDEKIVWKILMPFSRRLAATASNTPSTRPRGTVNSTYFALICRPEVNSSPVRTSLNWLQPT